MITVCNFQYIIKFLPWFLCFFLAVANLLHWSYHSNTCSVLVGDENIEPGAKIAGVADVGNRSSSTGRPRPSATASSTSGGMDVWDQSLVRRRRSVDSQHVPSLSVVDVDMHEFNIDSSTEHVLDVSSASDVPSLIISNVTNNQSAPILVPFISEANLNISASTLDPIPTSLPIENTTINTDSKNVSKTLTKKEQQTLLELRKIQEMIINNGSSFERVLYVDSPYPIPLKNNINLTYPTLPNIKNEILINTNIDNKTNYNIPKLKFEKEETKLDEHSHLLPQIMQEPSEMKMSEMVIINPLLINKTIQHTPSKKFPKNEPIETSIKVDPVIEDDENVQQDSVFAYGVDEIEIFKLRNYEEEISKTVYEFDPKKPEVTTLDAERIENEVKFIKKKSFNSKNITKFDEADTKDSEFDSSHDESDINHDESNIKHDGLYTKSIELDINHDKSDSKVVELDLNHGESNTKHDESDEKHGGLGTKHDYSVYSNVHETTTLLPKHDTSVSNTNSSLITLTFPDTQVHANRVFVNVTIGTGDVYNQSMSNPVYILSVSVPTGDNIGPINVHPNLQNIVSTEKPVIKNESYLIPGFRNRGGECECSCPCLKTSVTNADEDVTFLEDNVTSITGNVSEIEDVTVNNNSTEDDISTTELYSNVTSDFTDAIEYFNSTENSTEDTSIESTSEFSTTDQISTVDFSGSPSTPATDETSLTDEIFPTRDTTESSVDVSATTEMPDCPKMTHPPPTILILEGEVLGYFFIFCFMLFAFVKIQNI